jgi:DNA (cytosine-5)-methyltransferase 1|tara:strand:- start:67 stop:1050 length:984 start_codon:yes stop_codon:yes gene_type:complete
MSSLRVLELFGGIGAIRKALERNKIDFKVIDYVEIDKFAVKSYNSIYDENYEPQDINNWDKDIDVNFIFHGSPCQDFSLAGGGAGGEKQSNTRSSLLWETLRIVKKLTPKIVMWENVSSVLNKKHKPVVDAYLLELQKLGYQSQLLKLNSSDYGIPQHRTRIYIVSKLQDAPIIITHLPKKLNTTLQDLLEEGVSETFTLSNQLKRYINSFDKDKKDNGAGKYVVSKTRLVLNRTIASTVSTRTGRNRADCSDYISNDFGLNENIFGMDLTPYHIRRLTPLECWRLMGFDDETFAKAKEVCSNTQLYKQAGNSIVVDVLCHILKELL